jgi:hypothetical protein
MAKSGLLKHFVSKIDQFLAQFDKEHPGLSKSQLKEKAKYQRIYYLRDVANRPEEKKLPEGL